MKAITAPQEYTRQFDDEIFCFLAGGISNCPDWQKEVINQLKEYDLKRLILFNPRRERFSIEDKSEAEKQIAWEFKYLQQMDIFSMYFCGSESVQPICMYELGRYLSKFSNKSHLAALSVEDGYNRASDVIIQSRLALGGIDIVKKRSTPKDHAKLIAMCYREVL